MISATYP